MKKRGNNSSAVMQQRAPAEVEADDAQTKFWRMLDYYPTPPWAARAGGEILAGFDPIPSPVLWEPACGEHHMSEPLRESFHVIESDIYHYNRAHRIIDFLDGEAVPCDWVITNPPFKRAADFVRKGLYVAKCGVAVLCRVSFLESEERYQLLYTDRDCLTLCAPFCERVPMQLGSWDPELSSASSYAWFFFVKNRKPLPIDPIPPGTRDRLWMPDDVRRFAPPAPIPLFEQDSRVTPSPASAEREKAAPALTPLAGAAAFAEAAR